MSLHDLLDEIARTAPPVDALRSADEAWGTAGRRRRRTRVTAGAVVIGLAVVAALVGTSIARPAQKPLPSNGELAHGQGVPALIYSVKPWLPTIGHDPIPPIAYLVEESYLDRPVAISVDGSYRYVPGPPDGRGYTLSSYAVSADGEHLALAWSGIGKRWSGTPVQAQIFAYDLLTGQTRGPWLGAGLGGEITELAWRPDNQGFAFQAHRVEVSGSGEATESVAVVAQYWDHYSKDIVGAEGPVAWSPDGTQLLVTRLDGPNPKIVDLPGGDSRTLDVPPNTVFGSGAWAVDGSGIAGLATRTNEVDLVIADPRTGIAGGRVAPLGEDLGEAVLGWRAGNPVLVNFGQPDLVVQAVDPQSVQPVGPPISRGAGKRADERVTAALAILDSAPVVDVPPPDQPRLSWAFLRTQPVGLVLVGMIALVLLASLGAVVTRRRRRSRVPGR